MKKTFLLGALLAVLLSNPSPAFASFSDVPLSHTYFDGIHYVQIENIVKGYPDGSYKPDNAINRAEFTKIIIEAIANDVMAENRRNCFTDVNADMWFHPYVCYAKLNGIIGGYSDGTFKPGQNISFVEAAKIIVIAFKYGAGTDDVWYKPYVDVLADRNAIPDTVKSFTKNITRGEMAEMIYRLKKDITNKPSTDYDKLSGKTPTPSPTTPVSTVPKMYSVSINNFSFGPAMTIRVGDSIIWKNDDSSDHSVKGSFVSGGESERLRNGQEFSFTFTKAGTFNYECGLHPGMTGTVVVNP